MVGRPCDKGDIPCNDHTFKSQGSFVLPLPGSSHMLLFMADMWFESNLADSRYVWLPLFVEPGLPGSAESVAQLRIRWYERWKLPQRLLAHAAG